MKGYLSSEQSRPQYDGVPSKSPIDGADMLYFPENVKQGRFIWSTVSGHVSMCINFIIFTVLLICVFASYL